MEDRETLEHETPLGLADAAVIEAEARTRAGRELELNRSWLLLLLGLNLLVGYGVRWLSVRNQHPYRGPSGAAWLAVFAACIAAGAARAAVVSRAVEGVAGRSPARIGLAALWVEADAVHRAGGSKPLVTVLAFAAPMVGFGLFLARAAESLNWRRLALGVLLLSAGAAGTLTGPATALAVYALAGGCGYIAASAVELRLRRT